MSWEGTPEKESLGVACVQYRSKIKSYLVIKYGKA